MFLVTGGHTKVTVFILSFKKKLVNLTDLPTLKKVVLTIFIFLYSLTLTRKYIHYLK